MSEQPFVSLTRRIGLRSHLSAQGDQHFVARHGDRDYGPDCELNERLRCACVRSVVKEKRCCARMTAEDMLCDACREWCK